MNKDNFYYYFFYVVHRFLLKLNKKKTDLTFNALGVLVFCEGFNIMVILDLLHIKAEIFSSYYLFIILLISILFLLNYYILIKDGKKTEIITYYDNTLKSVKLDLSLIAIITYFTFTVLSTFYVAYSVRHHLI